MNITIFGGGGFIGRHLAAELARRGHALSLPVRNREGVKDSLILLPQADVYAYDPNSMTKIKKRLAGSDAVVNLVGILNENSRNLYDRVHGEFVRMMMEGCAKNQVPRVVQISAIGASPGAPSAYLRSKAKGEQLVKANDAVSYAIIRPSVVFGEGDSFINRFAPLLRHFPALPVPMAAAQFQPIYVGDLVTMIANVLEDDAYRSKTLHAGGPEVLTLEDILRRIAQAMGRTPRLLPLGRGLSYALAAVAEKMPFVELITRDNCNSMTIPSVCPKDSRNHAADIVPRPLTSLDAALAEMFAAQADPYGHLRPRAGRQM